MPTSPERQAAADRLAARVQQLVGQGLELQQIMERLGISKGHAVRLIRTARSEATP